MREVFLSHRRDVDVMRYFQRLQRIGGSVVIKHKTVAAYLGCSESSVRRSINRLVKQGHIIRTYVSRPRGGLLCAYFVRTDVIYRRASTFRRAKMKIEQVARAQKLRSQGRFGRISAGVGRVKNNKRMDNKRSAHPSIDFEKERRLLDGLMKTAKVMGIDDTQRGFLRSAARRFGVVEAWTALKIAYESGYLLPDLVKVTWGILKRQYPQGVMA